MLALAHDFARRCADALEKWIASREVTEEKLFSFLYYPMPKTDPPKYTTDWDRLSDRDVLPIEESILARSPAILFTVMVDKFGYLPTHNQRYSLPLTPPPIWSTTAPSGSSTTGPAWQRRRARRPS